MHEFGVPKYFRADRNERVQTNILGPRIMLELVSHHLMHEFGVPKHFRADRNERIQRNILGPRIMLELVSHHLVDAPSCCNRGHLGAFNAQVWGADTFWADHYKHIEKTI